MRISSAGTPKGDKVGQVQGRLIHGAKHGYPTQLSGIDAGVRSLAVKRFLNVVENPRMILHCYDHHKKNEKARKDGRENCAWASSVIRRQEHNEYQNPHKTPRSSVPPQWPISADAYG